MPLYRTMYIVEVNRGGFRSRGTWDKVLRTEDHDEVVAKTKELLAENIEQEIVITVEKQLI